MTWKGIVGKSMSPEEFRDYVDGLTWGQWKPQFITLHNTAVPSLRQRPDGFTERHIRNLEAFYKSKDWKSGPHLFIDDKQIWLFTPLTTTGTHSPSWNTKSIGVEMLGDYNVESFTEGRGLKVRQNTVAAMAALLHKLGLSSESWRFHKEDKATTHDCPGKNVRVCREELNKEIAFAMFR